MMSGPTVTSRLRRFLQHHHPSAFLLAAQLLLLLLYTTSDGLHRQQAFISAVGVVVLAMVLWVVNRSPGVDWIAWVLAAPAVILLLLAMFIANPALVLWSSLLEAVIYFYAAASLIAYMMEDYRVTTDELFAAGATFTLFAWGFAYLYQVCQIAAPGSFVSSLNPGQSLSYLELLSLSFTNLTATGLSDILPVTPMARVLVMLEQFSGIGYVAVVVSRLIGLTIQQQERKRPRINF